MGIKKSNLEDKFKKPIVSRKVRIIPRLDIKGSNLIKGIQLEGLRIIGDPNTFAKKYYEEGADELFMGYDRIFRWANNQSVLNLSEFDDKYCYGTNKDNEVLIA